MIVMDIQGVAKVLLAGLFPKVGMGTAIPLYAPMGVRF